MRRFSWLVAVFAVLGMSLGVVLLSGCDSGGPSEIKVGIIEDLSGATSAWGEGLQNGAIYAIEKINKEGGLLGKQIKYTSYDFKGNVPESLTAYNRLVDQDKVVAVIGTPNSAMHIALAPLADEKKVPVIGDPMDERATTPEANKVNAYTFLGEPAAGEQARAIASYTLNEMKLKKVAILFDQGNPYSVSLATPFAEYFSKNGGQVVANEPFQSGTNDFRAQLTKIKQSSPEVLHITSYLKENSLIVAQMRELGMNIPVVGNNSCFYPFAETAGKDAEGVVFPNNISLDDPRYQDYISGYKARFGKDPVVHAWMGYDNMMILANAIKKANKIDSVAIRDAIENQTKDVQGMTDKITIDPKTHRPVNLPLAILQVKDGKYATLKASYLPK
ncbi:MAG TPA: ABC transporter substrate-binding protein [Chloroflexota bacterium]|nr:ABC transporter substrate-binding protein [Chloroflexota bacterium]HEX2988525.1 ABC transporter substrate-binding protein [Chloroflexota bacterium]